MSNKKIEQTQRRLLYEVMGTKVFEGGAYEMQEPGCPKVVGYVSEFYDISSAQFNQLKAKLFNLIEASIPNMEQNSAIKGLVKGFCNQHYKNLVGDLHRLMHRLRLLDTDSNPMAENELDNRNR